MRRLRQLALFVGAFVILSGADSCDLALLDDLVVKSGSITVSNIGTTEVAVVAISGPDFKSYPTLLPGQSSSQSTHVSGSYEVRVVMTPANREAHLSNLRELRELVKQAVNTTLSDEGTIALYARLGGINAAIQALEQADAAGCSGTIELNTEKQERVSASIAWVAQDPSGYWTATCGSN